MMPKQYPSTKEHLARLNKIINNIFEEQRIKFAYILLTGTRIIPKTSPSENKDFVTDSKIKDLTKEVTIALQRLEQMDIEI